jgi:general secretion pathway protein F
VTSFSYSAARADGSIERGSLTAESRAAAVNALGGRGLFVIIVAAEAQRLRRRGNLNAPEVALGLRVLADLLESGLPLSRALAVLEELAAPSWQRVLPAIRESVRAGTSFASALSATAVFPDVVIGLVQAGESGSGLGAALRRGAEFTEQTAVLHSTIIASLAYPAVLACAGVASVGLMVGIVLPRFAAILGELGQSLPPVTHFVIQGATLARLATLPFLVALVAAVVIWHAWTSTVLGRRQWHDQLLALPLIGDIRRAAATARYFGALAALLENGVAISAGLIGASRAAGDAAISARVLEARELVSHGERLSRALDRTRAATPLAIRLTRAGEESSNLTRMMNHVAKLEHDRAARLVRTATRVLEPTLVICIGGLIALVAAALLQAVYSVRPVP